MQDDINDPAAPALRQGSASSARYFLSTQTLSTIVSHPCSEMSPFLTPVTAARRYIKLLVRTVSHEEKVVKALPSFTVQNVKEVVARLPERVVLACLFFFLLVFVWDSF